MNGATASGPTVALNPIGAWTTWAKLRIGDDHTERRASNLSLLATTSGGLANMDSLTVTGNGVSATPCN